MEPLGQGNFLLPGGAGNRRLPVLTAPYKEQSRNTLYWLYSFGFGGFPAFLFRRIRKEILQDVVSHGYYDSYGCYAPIKELAGKLYITDKETLEFADLLNEHETYAREAADLYCQYGKTDRYIQYLETHLSRTSKEYIELIQCYCNAGNKLGAREIAEQGLKHCKDDLTEIFIYLLKEAKACKDKERYKKLYASAKRRKFFLSNV